MDRLFSDSNPLALGKLALDFKRHTVVDTSFECTVQLLHLYTSIQSIESINRGTKSNLLP